MISASEKNVAVGIVLGSISLTFVAIFGILIVLYCCTKSKKPPIDLSNKQFDYSYADDESPNHNNNNTAETDHEEEHETAFDSSTEYQPPLVTPLVKNDDNDN